MFREMRRKKQILSEKECVDILEKGTAGVLALLGDNDYPYAVPISYVYYNFKLFFHGAKSGHKIDAIKKCSKASFCVIDQDHIVPEEYTTYFRSVIAFGKIHIMEDETEMKNAIERLAVKYYPTDTETNRNTAINREWKLSHKQKGGNCRGTREGRDISPSLTGLTTTSAFAHSTIPSAIFPKKSFLKP